MFCGTPPAHPDAAPDCDLLAIFKPLQLRNGLESEVKIIAAEQKKMDQRQKQRTQLLMKLLINIRYR